MAGERPETTFEQHADRSICAHPNVGHLPAVGLGYTGQRTGIVLSKALWIGFGFKWAHPPNYPKDWRQHYFPYRQVHRISAASTRCSSVTGPNESSC